MRTCTCIVYIEVANGFLITSSMAHTTIGVRSDDHAKLKKMAKKRDISIAELISELINQ